MTSSKVSGVVARASEHVHKTTGLTWFDFLYYRYQKGFTGENSLSMETIDTLHFMKGLEFLDIQSYIENAYHEVAYKNK